MHSSIRGRITALVVSSLALSVAACRSDGHTSEVQVGLDAVVWSDVADNGYLGTGVSVRLTDGRVLRSVVGFSDPEEGDLYDLSSTEQIIGSVTKLYTAVLVMQLVEGGQLALDDTVDRWLSFPGADRITVRMLLSHTSGLSEYLDKLTLEQLGQPWSPEQLLQVALDAGPLGEPGMEQGIYTNTNFLVLAMIVEAVTGKSWEDGVQERIARPLGLRHTYYAGQRERAGHLAGGWMQTEDGWLDTLTLLDPSVGWGCGAMVTTNEELMRFTEALFDGELFESPDTLARMLRFDTQMNPAYLGQDPPSRVGLGIIRMEVDGMQLEGHLGHAEGYNAGALRDPATGELIVVTSNDNRAFSGYTALKVAQYLRDR